MIPGPDDEINLLLLDVGFFAPEAKLVAALEQLITPHYASVVSLGRPVVKASEGVEVLAVSLARSTMEGSTHTGQCVTLCYLCVTAGASRGIHVSGFGTLL